MDVGVLVAVAGADVTVTVKLPEALLPASSVAKQLTAVVPTLNVEPVAGEQIAEPERFILSVADAEYVTTAPPGPVAVVVMLDGKFRTGAVLSILIVTITELERLTLLVTEQVRVVPAVSSVKVEAVQPVEEKMPDSGSSTVQLTVTSLVYQPPDPSMPLMFGVMTGAVPSVTNISFEQPNTLLVHAGLVTM